MAELPQPARPAKAEAPRLSTGNFDVYALSEGRSFEGEILLRALRSTFSRRRTLIPGEMPAVMTPEFVQLEGKVAQWTAFMRGLPTSSAPVEFVVVLNRVSEFLGPLLAAAARSEEFRQRWRPGGPWQSPWVEEVREHHDGAEHSSAWRLFNQPPRYGFVPAHIPFTPRRGAFAHSAQPRVAGPVA